MPLPQGYLPREGDVLVLHAIVSYTVRSEDSDRVFVRPVGYYQDCRIEMSSVVGIHARKWEPGESARYGVDAITVIAIDDDEAWIKYPDGRRQSVNVNVLDAEPVPVDEPPHRPQTDDTDPIADQRMDAADVELVDDIKF